MDQPMGVDGVTEIIRRSTTNCMDCSGYDEKYNYINFR